MNLSDNLKRIRKDNNLSQEQLADKLNVSRQSVSKWESGAAYPEMDKVLQICKMFNLNIDELLNQDIKQVNENKKNKVDVNKYIDSFLKYITKTVDMFNSMNTKEIFKCLFEQAFIAFILFIIFSILYGICGIFFGGILSALHYNNVVLCIFNVGETILETIFFILGIIIMLHIFKTRYLDYYTIVKEDKEEYIEEKIEEENKKVKKEKIIIRDPKHGEYRFINGLLKFILICIKCFIGFVAIGFCFSFIGLVIALVMSFLIIKTGLTFVGGILAIIGAIIINLIILNILYNFIANKKINLKLIFIGLIASLVAIGTGIGLFVTSLKDYTVVDGYSASMEKTIKMEDNLLFHNWLDTNFVEEERDDIKIVVEHNGIYDFNVEYMEDKGYKVANVYVVENSKTDLDMINKIINDINNKKMIDYGDTKVTVYASKENLDKLRKNNSALTQAYDEEEMN